MNTNFFAHSMQLLVQQLSPEPSNHGFGIVMFETASYVLQAYRPETGVQFFVTADLRSENLAAFLVCTYFPSFSDDVGKPMMSRRII